MAFQFRTPGEIRFGAGEGRKAPEIAARFGPRVFLVTGARSIEHTGFLDLFKGRDVVRWSVPREPDVALVDEGARLCREARCDAVLGAGGGSVLDGAKAVAALATNDGGVLDYLEEVGDGRAIGKPPLPFIAVPTTAGSGSEATRNAVVRVPERSVKRSLRHDLLLPRVAIVDPELSGSAPRDVAAAAGLDALTHLIESYTSTGAQPTTDVLALSGIRLAARALRALADDRATGETREAMALASLWGGIALANAGLGAVHGLVAPLGGRCAIPHGVACAALLPETLNANLAALRARAPSNPAIARYAEIEAILPIPSLSDLRRRLGVRSLGALGMTEADVAPIVKDSRGSSMKYNPVVLTDAELAAVLRAAIRGAA